MTIKAEITDVQIGQFTIAGLMNENGEFGVAVPQMADLNIVPPNRSLKQLEALTDGFQFEKWQTPLNSKPVNVLLMKDFESFVFALAQSGNAKAIEMWNEINPDTPFIHKKAKEKKNGIESRFEAFVVDLYREFNPQRQVRTDFGIADIVHDHGVVEIKEYRDIRSVHTAMGQAMSYGSILTKQPEVVLFNVPDSDIQRVIRIFTAVGILVLVYNKDDTKLALRRQKWYPTQDNSMDIQIQIKTLN